jgi:translocation protein SEC62
MADLLPTEYQADEGLRTLANFLRSGQHGVKGRSAIEHEKRVDYFKGKRLVECILGDNKKWPKSIPKITDKGTAILVAGALLNKGFFHRSEKVEGKKGVLRITQKNVFEDSGYYTWMYAGNMVWQNIATGAVIALVIIFTLMPIWPDVAKKVLWYCSVTFLIFTMAFCLIRFVLFLSLWLLGYDFWIFPRLFDESLSFQDSFKPVYSFEKGPNGQGYYRIGVLALLGWFVYWACTQPTEFDGFLKAQKEFIDDIYSGNLLSDVAHNHRETLDRTRRMPSLEDLLREMAEQESIEAADAVNKRNNVESEPSAEEQLQAAADAETDRVKAETDDNLLEELLKKQEDEDEAAEAAGDKGGSEKDSL